MTSVRSYVNYSRLVILSFAFHSGALKNQTPGQDVVMRVSAHAAMRLQDLLTTSQCLDAASSVIKVIVEVHAKTEYLRCTSIPNIPLHTTNKHGTLCRRS